MKRKLGPTNINNNVKKTKMIQSPNRVKEIGYVVANENSSVNDVFQEESISCDNMNLNKFSEIYTNNQRAEKKIKESKKERTTCLSVFRA